MTDAVAGRDLWLLGGQVLLRRGGIPAVKLHSLTAEIGLTTGSFYHHFAGMAEYLDDLARFYGSEQVSALLATVAHPDPRGRLRGLALLALDGHMRSLDAAMRDWAGSNAIAAAAVTEADAMLLTFVEEALVDLGHGRAEARTRALVLISSGVARVQTPWDLPDDILDRVIDLVAGPG